MNVIAGQVSEGRTTSEGLSASFMRCAGASDDYCFRGYSRQPPYSRHIMSLTSTAVFLIGTAVAQCLAVGSMSLVRSVSMSNATIGNIIIRSEYLRGRGTSNAKALAFKLNRDPKSFGALRPASALIPLTTYVPCISYHLVYRPEKAGRITRPNRHFMCAASSS